MCEYCRNLYGHDCACPNYEPPKASAYCNVCKDGIYDGEEYVENDCGECAHVECVYYMKDLLEFLNYEIKTMRNDTEEEW